MHQWLLFKETKTKEKKEKAKKQTQKSSCSSHPNKGTEQNTKPQEQNKIYKMIPTQESPQKP